MHMWTLSLDVRRVRVIVNVLKFNPYIRTAQRNRDQEDEQHPEIEQVSEERIKHPVSDARAGCLFA